MYQTREIFVLFQGQVVLFWKNYELIVTILPKIELEHVTVIYFILVALGYFGFSEGPETVNLKSLNITHIPVVVLTLF